MLIKLSDWAIATTENLSDAEWQIMLTQEHGGMNEVLADVYGLTGETKYLDLSRKFYQKSVLDPLTQRQDQLAGLHGNTQIPKLIGLARLYELTGDTKDETAAAYFWDRVVHTRTYAIGGNTDGEHFDAPGALSQHLSPGTAETCNTYNMLKLTRHLFEWTPTAEYADFYERALYNHIPRLAGPEAGHDDLLRLAQTRPLQDLQQPDRIVLVLRRHRHGEPCQIRRQHLFPQRRTACGSTCSFPPCCIGRAKV